MSAARPRNSISQRFLLGLRNDRLGARARIDTSSPARQGLSSRADIVRSARLVLQRPHAAKSCQRRDLLLELEPTVKLATLDIEL